jgi:hypothetical protein
MLAQILYQGFRIGEISCPAAYFEEASSINFSRSLKYGIGVLGVSVQLLLQRMGVASYAIFDPNGRKLEVAESRSPAGPTENPAQN